MLTYWEMGAPHIMAEISTITQGQLQIYVLPRSYSLDEEKYFHKLFEQERSYLDEVKSPKRRKEYIRRCFLFHQIYSNHPLIKSQGGDPQRPKGTIGSLSHKAGHTLMTLIDKPDPLLSTGIDLENFEKMHEGLFKKVCGKEELELLKGAEGWSEIEVASLIFSYKEALYKAIHPIGRKFFYFHDAEVTDIDFANGEITAQLLIDTSTKTPKGTTCRGHFERLSIDGEEFVLSSYSF